MRKLDQEEIAEIVGGCFYPTGPIVVGPILIAVAKKLLENATESTSDSDG